MVALIFLVLAFVMLFRTFLTLEKADRQALIEMVTKKDEADIEDEAMFLDNSAETDDEEIEPLETESIYAVDMRGNKVIGFAENEDIHLGNYENAKTVFINRIKTVLYLLFFSGLSFLIESTIRFVISYRESDGANIVHVYNIIMVVGWVIIYSLILYFNNLSNRARGINRDSERFAFVVTTTFAIVMYFNVLIRDDYTYQSYKGWRYFSLIFLSIIAIFLIIGILRIILKKRQGTKFYKRSLIIRIAVLPVVVFYLCYILINIFVPVNAVINPDKYGDISIDVRSLSNVQIKYILTGFDISDDIYWHDSDLKNSVKVNWYHNTETNFYKDKSDGFENRFHYTDNFKIYASENFDGKYNNYGSIRVYKSNAQWLGFPFADRYDAYLALNFRNAIIEIKLSNVKRSELDFSKYIKLIENRLSNKTDGSFKLKDYAKNLHSEKLNYGSTLNVLDAVDHAGQAFIQLEDSSDGEKFYHVKNEMYYCDKMIIKYDKENKAWLVQYIFGDEKYNAIINENGDVLGAWQVIPKQ